MDVNETWELTFKNYWAAIGIYCIKLHNFTCAVMRIPFSIMWPFLKWLKVGCRRKLISQNSFWMASLVLYSGNTSKYTKFPPPVCVFTCVCINSFSVLVHLLRVSGWCAAEMLSSCSASPHLNCYVSDLIGLKTINTQINTNLVTFISKRKGIKALAREWKRCGTCIHWPFWGHVHPHACLIDFGMAWCFCSLYCESDSPDLFWSGLSTDAQLGDAILETH